jgi:hypothetical protein
MDLNAPEHDRFLNSVSKWSAFAGASTFAWLAFGQLAGR